MSLRKTLVTAAVCAVALAATPRNASADWTLTPFVGWNFGGSADVNNPAAGTNFNNSFDHKIDYGVSIAGMGTASLGENSISATRRTSSRPMRPSTASSSQTTAMSRR